MDDSDAFMIDARTMKEVIDFVNDFRSASIGGARAWDEEMLYDLFFRTHNLLAKLPQIEADTK